MYDKAARLTAGSQRYDIEYGSVQGVAKLRFTSRPFIGVYFSAQLPTSVQITAEIVSGSTVLDSETINVEVDSSGEDEGILTAERGFGLFARVDNTALDYAQNVSYDLVLTIRGNNVVGSSTRADGEFESIEIFRWS